MWIGHVRAEDGGWGEEVHGCAPDADYRVDPLEEDEVEGGDGCFRRCDEHGGDVDVLIGMSLD